MTAYLALLLAVLSRILPHSFGTTSVGFTAVGGGLLFFGARQGGGWRRWQTVIAVLTMMATDYYLTAFVYNYPFQVRAYVVTWFWYAAVCMIGYGMLRNKQVQGETSAPSMLRVAGAVLASSTSFFILSNFMVWAGSTMYAHSAAGLAACFVAAIPFYANDVMSTAVTAGALFGLPVLAKSIAQSIREAQNNQLPLA
ncbi:MAG: hypothetical protein JWM43_2269 [Acidobacteriaceae bacterium]|nr:hypothetical protein [Acidobacteriaceae bacterium]